MTTEKINVERAQDTEDTSGLILPGPMLPPFSMPAGPAGDPRRPADSPQQVRKAGKDQQEYL